VSKLTKSEHASIVSKCFHTCTCTWMQTKKVRHIFRCGTAFLSPRGIWPRPRRWSRLSRCSGAAFPCASRMLPRLNPSPSSHPARQGWRALRHPSGDDPRQAAGPRRTPRPRPVARRRAPRTPSLENFGGRPLFVQIRHNRKRQYKRYHMWLFR
jgi:hypothetical protein